LNFAALAAGFHSHFGVGGGVAVRECNGLGAVVEVRSFKVGGVKRGDIRAFEGEHGSRDYSDNGELEE
jgi:hypothetical protein